MRNYERRKLACHPQLAHECSGAKGDDPDFPQMEPTDQLYARDRELQRAAYGGLLRPPEITERAWNHRFQARFLFGLLVGVGCWRMVLGPRLGTLTGTLRPMPVCALWVHGEDLVARDRGDLAGCSASHYNCSARIGAGMDDQ